MAIITIENVTSQVTGLTKASTRAINQDLSARAPGYNFSPTYKSGMWDGYTRFFQIQNGKFPTGLLSRVYKSIKECGEEVELIDKRKWINVEVPDILTLGNGDEGEITLRDYQHDAVCKALKATRGVINAATNSGKTEIACSLIKTCLPYMGEEDRILFFTHSKEIYTQSVERLSKRLDMEVGQVGAGKWDVRPVTVVMIPTVSKYLSKPSKPTATKKYKELIKAVSDLEKQYKLAKNPVSKSISEGALKVAQAELSEYEKEQVGKLMENYKATKKLLDSAKMFIGDEVHHASSDTWYKLFKKLPNAFFRYGLTGTVDESNPVNVLKLFGSTGRIVSKVSNQFLIENEYSAKPIINMISTKGYKKCTAPFYMEVRKEGIIHNEDRNRLFCKKIIERARSGKQCLIIVNETEHGEVVLEKLQDQGFTVDFIHGQRTDKVRQNALVSLKKGELSVLIATSILDEGVDVSGINCIFLMSGGKSMRQLLQRIGRGLRKKSDGSSVEIYDCLDEHDTKYLSTHAQDRLKVYQEEGFEIRPVM